MTSHVLLPALDPDRPATLSPVVLAAIVAAVRDRSLPVRDTPGIEAARRALRVDVRETSRPADVLRAVGSAPVVALVRDPHRHPWALDLLSAVAAARPDLVVVEMGWPAAARLPGAAVVRTYGASAASGVALDELLSGRWPE